MQDFLLISATMMGRLASFPLILILSVFSLKAMAHVSVENLTIEGPQYRIVCNSTNAAEMPNGLTFNAGCYYAPAANLLSSGDYLYCNASNPNPNVGSGVFISTNNCIQIHRDVSKENYVYAGVCPGIADQIITALANRFPECEGHMRNGRWMKYSDFQANQSRYKQQQDSDLNSWMISH